MGRKYYSRNLSINNNIIKKRACVVKKWREMVDVLSRVCLLKFKKKSNFFKKNGYIPRHNKLNNRKKYKNGSSLHFQDLLKTFSENDFLKYNIFKNLWQKGFCLTCGIKFGGCFLVYAGNIVDVHSYISIITVPFNFNFISPKLLIAFGRTGTITKKFSIIANLDRSCLIKFMSLRWHSFLP